MNDLENLKIIVAGNVGSGKTTGITTISEIPVIGTEQKATETEALHRKPSTTVAMEYGIVHVNNVKVHLYGTPGQRRFDFMATLLCKGASGMIVMIDNGHTNPLGELDYYLKFHKDFLSKYPAIIAVTHYDDNRTHTSLIEYHQYVLQHGFNCAIMRLDAREKTEVLRVVEKLVAEILKRKNNP